MKIYYPTSMWSSALYGNNPFNAEYFRGIIGHYQVPRYRGTEGDIFAECNGPGFPPYAISVGQPVSIPLPPPFTFSRFSRPCNERFESRKRDGEIVVSNMTAHGVLMFVDTPGFEIVPLGGGPWRTFSLGLAEGFRPVSPPATWWGDYYDDWGGTFHGVAGVEYGAGELTYSKASDYPLSQLADVVKSQHSTEVNGELVQSVHAEANSGTMDLLTEFAELPETLRWIYDSFKKARSVIDEFKKKDFSLNERTRQRQNSLRQRISALHDMLARNSLTERQKEHFNREMRKLNKDLTFSIYELGQKTSSLWLQFRYALTPVIYSIKDACKITFKQKTFRKFRKRNIAYPQIADIGDWFFDGDITVTQRANIKRSFAGNLSIWSLLKREFAPNVLKTLWEVTRFSFVADWFVSIGDAISAAFRSTNAFLQEGATYSVKTAIMGSFRNRKTHASIKVEANFYDRSIIIPSDYTGLYFGADMGWKRQLDALALFLWPSIRRTFK